jgi:hypothetical protein
MTTTPYDPGDDPVAPAPLVPEELDDREPDVADDEDDDES